MLLAKFSHPLIGLDFIGTIKSRSPILPLIKRQANFHLVNFGAGMALFGNLFGGKPKPDGNAVPPEVAKLFDKINELLNNKKLQNSLLPPEVKSIIESGLSVDELPGASGDFGRNSKNPIPVNSPIGEIIYLSNLITSNASFLLSHRLGSLNSIDVYELVSADGAQWDILFLSYYHPRKLRKAPTGLTIRTPGKAAPYIFATNSYVPSFPVGMSDAVAESSQRILGVPLRSPLIREALERGSFRRPAVHMAKLKALSALGFILPKDFPIR